MSGDDKQLELEALAAVGEMLLFDQARGNPEEAACWRRFKIEPPCRLNFEPGLQASLRGPAVDKCSA